MNLTNGNKENLDMKTDGKPLRLTPERRGLLKAALSKLIENEKPATTIDDLFRVTDDRIEIREMLEELQDDKTTSISSD